MSCGGGGALGRETSCGGERERERDETHAREKDASMTEAIVNYDLVVAFDEERGCHSLRTRHS